MNYEKDKNLRMTFRLNETMGAFVKERAQSHGISPADFVRNLILNAKVAYELISAGDKMIRGPHAESAKIGVDDENNGTHQ